MLYISLLNNITLLVTLGVIHSLLLRSFKQDSVRFQILSGLLFGSVTVIGMLNSVEILPGIIFDGRSIIILTAGVFGGPLTAIISILISVTFRLYIGGAGTVMGMLVIAEAGILGIVYYYLRRKFKWASGMPGYYGLGLIVHIIMIILSLILPGGLSREILPQILIPVLLIFPVATFLLFLLFQSQENYLKLVKDLSASKTALNEANLIAGIGRWRLDIQTNKLEWTDNIYNIFEINRDEFDATYNAFLTPVHPADRDFVDKMYKDSLKTKLPYEIEHRLLMKDGRIKWVIEKCRTEFDVNGRAVCSTGIVQEITERKIAREALEESRQMLRLIIDTIPVRVFWKGKDNKYLGCNLAFAKDAGFANPDDLIGMDDYQMNWKLEAELYRAADQDVILSGKPKMAYEEPQTTPEGKTRWLQTSKLPLTDIKGNIIGVLGAYEDITLRKQMDDDLVVAMDKAQESDRLKTAFLNNLSHEIRTPLNAIVGFSELLNKGKTSENETRNYTEIINQSSGQLLAILDSIFDIAALEAGQVNINIKKTNVNKLLNLVNEQFRIKAKEKGIELIFMNSLKEDEANILTDGTKLSQVLNNLLTNAIKFTREGRVVLSCSKTDELLFCVKDTGIGIPVEMHDIIFERFRQGNFPPGGEYGGNGLGLFISRSYVELLGGKIWVNSEPGKGSEFHFSLPITSSPEGEEIPSPVQNTKFNGSKTILIAEDNSVNFLLLKEYLSVFDLILIHAWNGKEAVEICKDKPEIDLVLMDVKMPVMNGLEATRLIKAFRSDLPVIALTAYAQSGDMEKSLLYGCDAYLSKPFKFDNLLSLLNKYL